MTDFEHVIRGQKVIFCVGNAAEVLSDEVRRLGATRPLIIGTDRGRVASRIAPAAHISVVRQHVPVNDVDRAAGIADRANADVLIAIGGGSATGLAKAVALTSRLPIICVPTTFAGSEATPMWGVTTDGTKTTGTSEDVLPQSILYDAASAATMPRAIAIPSGINAMAHAVDALWAPRADPLSAINAASAIELLAAGLRAISSETHGMDAWQQSFLGAYLAATAFASSGSGIHHKICRVLGGRYDLSHADLHAVILPHVVALNAPCAPGASAIIARGLGATTAVSGVWRLYRDLDFRAGLASLGLPATELDDAATACLGVIPGSNPRSVDEATLRALLQDAWSGNLPTEEPDD